MDSDDVRPADFPKQKGFGIEVIEATNDLQLITYGVHAEGQRLLDCFDVCKRKYKNEAKKWVVSLGLGLLFLYTRNYLNSENMYLVSILTLFGWLGIRRLRYVEVNLYHKKMAHVFLEMVRLEETYAFLNNSASTMNKTMHNKSFDPVLFDSSYYGWYGLIMVIMAVFVLFSKSDKTHHWFILTSNLCLIGIATGIEIVSIVRSLRHGAGRNKSKGDD